MTFTRIILVFSWLIFILYWLISSRYLKPTKEKHQFTHTYRKFRFLFIALMIALILLNRFTAFPGLPKCTIGVTGCHLSDLLIPYEPIPLQVIGLFLSTLGLAVALIARHRLGRNWSAGIDVKKNHELITTGIYGYVRHPIYTGMVLMSIGTMIIFPIYTTYIAFAFVFIIFYYKIKGEEELMTKTFPKQYPAYKKRVKTLIPYLF